MKVSTKCGSGALTLRKWIFQTFFAPNARILAGQLLAPLQPGAAAQADSDVRAVGDGHRPLVALVVAEDAPRHPGEHGHWRIVGMNADVHAGLFGDRDHLLDEVGVVLPDLLFRELPAVRERPLENL